MKDEEFKELEKLLLKLEGELEHRYCILPYINDCWALAIYTRSGDLIRQQLGLTIQDAVEKIKVS